MDHKFPKDVGFPCYKLWVTAIVVRARFKQHAVLQPHISGSSCSAYKVITHQCTPKFSLKPAAEASFEDFRT